jgi:hypothetical protein
MEFVGNHLGERMELLEPLRGRRGWVGIGSAPPQQPLHPYTNEGYPSQLYQPPDGGQAANDAPQSLLRRYEHAVCNARSIK